MLAIIIGGQLSPVIYYLLLVDVAESQVGKLFSQPYF